jgi:cholest-4-en-3-one 26-monooxygenase
MSLAPRSVDEIDFWDLDMFEHGDPHQAYRLLRAEAPVWWHDRPGGEPFWAITTQEPARRIFADAPGFSSQAAGVRVRDTTLLEQPNPAEELGIHPMIHTDPPRHTPLRKLVARRFTPRSIAELEAMVRGFARRTMADAAAKGEVDFVNDIAHRMPAQVTFALLDVPESEWDRLAELEHQTITHADPELAGDDAHSASAAGQEVFGYFAGLVLERLEAPGDDLISAYIKGRIDDEPLRWEQVVAEAGLLLAGGLDTTRAAASAGAMLPLLQDRARLAELWADPTLLATAVDEFVRWASPITSEMRTVTADVEVGGQSLAAGQRIVIWGASCNRDESVFADPFTFDLRRAPNPHLGFSFGEHFCLGAHLARLILRVEFEELITAFADIEQTGDASRVRSNFVGGLKHLPVRVIPR